MAVHGRRRRQSAQTSACRFRPLGAVKKKSEANSDRPQERLSRTWGFTHRPVSTRSCRLPFSIVDIANLLAAAADGVAKFGDSIAHLVQLGVAGYDAVAARKARAELVELRAALVGFVSGANMPLLKAIDDYVDANPRPSPEVLGQWWIAILDKVDFALAQVRTLLVEVEHVRSDFVLQTAYSQLNIALGSRSPILFELHKIPPPVQPDELNALRKLGIDYRRLSNATTRASQQLDQRNRAHSD
jgi:hypothetical protein